MKLFSMLIIVFIAIGALLISPTAIGQEPLGAKASSSVSARIISPDQVVEIGFRDASSLIISNGFSKQSIDSVMRSGNLYITLNCE